MITKHGKPDARVIPFEQQEADLIGSLRHKIKITGDILHGPVGMRVLDLDACIVNGAESDYLQLEATDAAKCERRQDKATAVACEG